MLHSRPEPQAECKTPERRRADRGPDQQSAAPGALGDVIVIDDDSMPAAGPAAGVASPAAGVMDLTIRAIALPVAAARLPAMIDYTKLVLPLGDDTVTSTVDTGPEDARPRPPAAHNPPPSAEDQVTTTAEEDALDDYPIIII